MSKIRETFDLIKYEWKKNSIIGLFIKVVVAVLVILVVVIIFLLLVKSSIIQNEKNFEELLNSI